MDDKINVELSTSDYLNDNCLKFNLTSDIISNNEYNKVHFWKYEEDKTLNAVHDYISQTYKGHYTSDSSKTQTLDLIESIGDGVPFCRDNIIKYSSRFGKKNGMSRLDALKIIHYGILLYHFAGLHNENKQPYETF